MATRSIGPSRLRSTAPKSMLLRNGGSVIEVFDQRDRYDLFFVLSPPPPPREICRRNWLLPSRNKSVSRRSSAAQSRTDSVSAGFGTQRKPLAGDSYHAPSGSRVSTVAPWKVLRHLIDARSTSFRNGIRETRALTLRRPCTVIPPVMGSGLFFHPKALPDHVEGT